MYGIPVKLPAPYPAKESVMANLVAIVGMRESWGADYVRAAYRRWLQLGQETGSEPNVSESLRDIGQDPARVLALANSEDAKAALTAETNVARELGIFGSPTLTVGRDSGGTTGWKMRSVGFGAVAWSAAEIGLNAIHGAAKV
jgi:2-hydroxychromene-2-carboxylate isomerase